MLAGTTIVEVIFSWPGLGRLVITCLPIIRDGVKEGALRAQSFLDRVHVHEFPQDKVLEAEPMGGCFLNANTPEQLEAVERMFLEG